MVLLKKRSPFVYDKFTKCCLPTKFSNRSSNKFSVPLSVFLVRKVGENEFSSHILHTQPDDHPLGCKDG